MLANTFRAAYVNDKMEIIEHFGPNNVQVAAGPIGKTLLRSRG